MDKQAFKQRMRNLKSYRENNPGKGYWDWKVQTFEDSGEVGGKKEPPYPSFYNGRRVNRWTGEPLATGALKPAVDLEDFANLTPVGDVITVNEMGNAAAKKDWSGLGWASLGLLPIVGSKGSKAIKAAIKGAERTAASTISREVPKVIAEYMNSLPDGMGEKMVYQSFKDPKTYRRWFNSIPTVGFIGAAYTGNKLLNKGDDNGQYIPNISDTNL